MTIQCNHAIIQCDHVIIQCDHVIIRAGLLACIQAAYAHIQTCKPEQWGEADSPADVDSLDTACSHQSLISVKKPTPAPSPLLGPIYTHSHTDAETKLMLKQ